MKTIAVFLPEGFADWETAYCLAAGRHFFGLTVRSFSAGGEPVRSIGGLFTVVDAPLREIDPAAHDILVLIGSETWIGDAAPDLTDAVEGFLGHGKPVGAICAATLALARAGILDTRRHTSNSLEFLQDNVPGYAGEPLYHDALEAVADQGVITASGLATVSFAAAVFRQLVPESLEQIATFQRMCSLEHAHRLLAETKEAP